MDLVQKTGTDFVGHAADHPVLLAQLSRIFKQKAKAIVVVAATDKPEMIKHAPFRPGQVR